ncbi:MAG: 3-phosphoserine/phosphohydroxythreonine transaminase [Candidatus Schekmanbacteria bacterium]|nr:3-phosphoserine/phosphohydroxythreonine transaminase [Candidatus Schekmanbacteria bacterium]
MANRVFNFSAGPSALPLPVLERARDELLDFAATGMGIMEMSHRSGTFTKVIEAAEAGVRWHLGVSDDYSVLFLQGGASLQFAQVPMNLYIEGRPIDVLHTGVWTKKAIAEMDKVATYRLAGSGEKDKFMHIPRKEEITLNPQASYVYMASNNTIYGSQWRAFPETGEVPLVADMSSDILSRRIDVSRFGLIFAGAQKNIGPAGVTLVIVRKDLLEHARTSLPTMLQYRVHAAERSLYNTPPTFAIYIASLVMDWITQQGGLEAIERRNDEKAARLYGAIDESELYYCPVERDSRSRMNVVFRLKGNDEALEAEFVAKSGKAGLAGLKGHRSVGGLRASIYNAVSLEAVEALIAFMADFERARG